VGRTVTRLARSRPSIQSPADRHFQPRRGISGQRGVCRQRRGAHLPVTSCGAHQRPGHPGRAGFGRLHARGPDFAVGQALAAHAHPLAGLQTAQHGRVERGGRLSHDAEAAAGGVHRAQRAYGGVQHHDALRLQLAARAIGLQRHHLAHRQCALRHRPAVLLHRRVGFVFDLQAIDADAAETGDHADDAGAAQAVVGHLTGTAQARALRDLPRATDARGLQGHLAGAAHAARVGRGTGCAGTAQARRAGHGPGRRGAAGAGVGRRRCGVQADRPEHLAHGLQQSAIAPGAHVGQRAAAAQCQ